MVQFSETARQLWQAPSLVLDTWTWTWRSANTPPPPDLVDVPLDEAVRLAHRAGTCRLVPVAVIGPRDPNPTERDIAEQAGHAIGDLGVPVLCGGKTGVMEAAARGAKRAGALTIGIVPDNAWQEANAFIDLPLATGLGAARNVIVARASMALVAVGGRYGTITEVAYGLHFDKPVFGLNGAPDVPGIRHLPSVAAVRDALLPLLLRLPDSS